MQRVLSEEFERLQRWKLSPELLIHVLFFLEGQTHVIDLLLYVSMRHQWSEFHLKSDLALFELLLGQHTICSVFLLFWHSEIKLTITTYLQFVVLLLVLRKEPIFTKQVILIDEIDRIAINVSKLLPLGCQFKLTWKRPFKFLFFQDLSYFLF